MEAAATGRVRHRDPTRLERVTPLELFFDLVFVFAITQVTSMLAADLSWAGLGRGMLVLAAIWWGWAAYAWLTNTLDPDESVVRVAMFAAMAAMLVTALAVPDAFDSHAFVFGLAYLAARILHLVLYALAARGHTELGRAVARMVPTLGGPILILTASAFDGEVQGAIWVLALVFDYVPFLITGMEGWNVSPGHFAERFGLIIIIALGESIVAIGVGAAGLELDVALVAVALLAIVIAAALWWAYFDVVAIVAERKLTEATGTARAELARDSYSYLHLPMVAGIVLLAVGVKNALAHVHEPLADVAAFALCGGVALYLVGHIAFRLRSVGTLNRHRLAAALVCLALIPAAREVEALASVGLVAAVAAGLITYETVRFREARARVRLAR